MSYKLLNYELSDVKITPSQKVKFVKLTLDSPPVNALSERLLDELTSALTQSENNGCRAIIITGGESKAFIAGADIPTMHKFSRQEAADFIEKGQQVTSQFENSSLLNQEKPTKVSLLSLKKENPILSRI